MDTITSGNSLRSFNRPQVLSKNIVIILQHSDPDRFKYHEFSGSRKRSVNNQHKIIYLCISEWKIFPEDVTR